MDETHIVYRVDDLGQIVGDNQRYLVAVSESTIQICASAIRIAEWPTRVYRGDDAATDDVDVNQLQRWHHLAIDELFGGVKMDDVMLVLRHINANLAGTSDDTSTALPVLADYTEVGLGQTIAKLEAKTPELYDIQQIISSLTGGSAFQEIKALLDILDLIPDLDIKISASDLLMTIWRIYGQSHALVAFDTMAAAQSTIAGTMVYGEAEETLDDLIQAIAAAVGVVGVVGDGWNSFFANLISLVDFFGSQEGDGPRAAQAILNQVFVEGDKLNLRVINECCVGAINVNVTVEQAPAAPGEPPEGTDDPDALDDRTCKVANMIADDLIRLAANMDNVSWLDWLAYQIAQALDQISKLYGRLLSEVAQTVLGYDSQMTEAIPFFLNSGGDFNDLQLVVVNNREDIICDLVDNADDAAAAKAALLAYFDSDEQALLDVMLPNNVFNLLSRAIGGSEAVIDAVVPLTDCSGCECIPYQLAWGTEIGFPSFDSEFNTGSDRHQLVMYWDCDEALDQCGPGVTLNSLTNWTGEAPDSDFRILVEQNEVETYSFTGSTVLASLAAWLPKSNVTRIYTNRSNSNSNKNDPYGFNLNWSE